MGREGKGCVGEEEGAWKDEEGVKERVNGREGEVVNDHPASGALPSSSFNMDPHQNHGSLTVISSMH